MARDFSGTWHWDDARASIDAVIATLPASPFRDELETADSRRSDSSVVWRWGLALARLHGLEEPWEYASALTNSQAIHRPSLAAREALGLPPAPVEGPGPTMKERWDDFVVRSRSAAGLPLPEEP